MTPFSCNKLIYKYQTSSVIQLLTVSWKTAIPGRESEKELYKNAAPDHVKLQLQLMK